MFVLVVYACILGQSFNQSVSQSVSLSSFSQSVSQSISLSHHLKKSNTLRLTRKSLRLALVNSTQLACLWACNISGLQSANVIYQNASWSREVPAHNFFLT